MIETDADKFRRVIEKSWADSKFRDRLISDPANTLKSEGIEPPTDTDIKVIQSSPKQRYFVLPPAPDSKLSAKEVKDKSQASDYKPLVHLLYNVNCC